MHFNSITHLPPLARGHTVIFLISPGTTG